MCVYVHVSRLYVSMYGFVYDDYDDDDVEENIGATSFTEDSHVQ
jgi:hypothetical protein